MTYGKLALLFAVWIIVLATPHASANSAAQAAPVALRQSILVTGKLVRLGDLFSGTGDKAATPVAYAPDLGKRAVFDARWLYRVARAYKLDWRPTSMYTQAVVERESVMVPPGEIEDRILAALRDKGVDYDVRVDLGNRRLRLYVPAAATASVAVEDLVYDRRAQRFSAVVVAPANHPEARRVRVTGRVYEVSEVPVLARRMLQGETISKQDLTWIKYPTRRLQRDVIFDAQHLIGMSPRRGMRAGVPVRTADVRRPLLIPRGSLVTMVLSRGPMLLTVQAKALEDGSRGDAIRVSNSMSHKVVEAIVIGAGKVTVRTASQVVMN